MSPFVGEVIGTMIIMIFISGAIGAVVLKQSKAHEAGWLVIVFGVGLGIAIAIYAVGDISGAHLNPAITIGLASIGAFPWSEVPQYILAQLIGAALGSTIAYLAYHPHWKKTENAELKLVFFATTPAVPNRFANVMTEMIGTFVLVFGILAIGVNEFTEGLNPLVIGFLLVAIGCSLGGPTGYAINPARDLGPRIAHALLPIPGKGKSGWDYAWIPIIGPIVGSVLGAITYDGLYNGKALLTLGGIVLIVLSLVVVSASLQRESAGRRNERPEIVESRVKV